MPSIHGTKKNNLYIVSELYYPETISTGYIMTEISKSLTRKFELTVIAGPELYENKNVSQTKPLEGISILRGSFRSYNKNKTTSRIYGNLMTSIKMFRLMLKHVPNNSEILMVTNPLLLFVIASHFAKRKSWKIKLIVHDVFPENLVILGFFKTRNSIIFKLLERYFRKAYHKMNSLIVLGRDMKEIFVSKRIPENRIKIIENWADTENIRQHTKKSQTLNFLFAGNLGRVQGLELLLEALNSVQKHNYQFTFIGSGALDSYISDYIRSNDLKHIKKFGWLPREKQDEFLAEATIGVISLKKGMYGLGVPSKCYNLLASGKPILYIGDKDSEVHRLLCEYDIGWFAEGGNLNDIVQTIVEIIECDKEQIELKGNRARQIAERLYAKDIILEKFQQLF